MDRRWRAQRWGVLAAAVTLLVLVTISLLGIRLGRRMEQFEAGMQMKNVVMAARLYAQDHEWILPDGFELLGEKGYLDAPFLEECQAQDSRWWAFHEVGPLEWVVEGEGLSVEKLDPGTVLVRKRVGALWVVGFLDGTTSAGKSMVGKGRGSDS